MTPKVLYQTWKTRSLPEKFQKNRDNWISFTPKSEGWTHPLLTDSDLRNLVKLVVPEHLKAYDSFTENIERVDFARYAMMYIGGVYADLDTYPMKSIEPFIELDKIVLGKEPYEHSKSFYHRKDVLCNAFMISPPKKKLWLDFMDFIVENYEPYYQPVYNTGPMAMTLFMERNPDAFKDVLITEPCVFFPLTGKGKVTEGCNMDKSTYVVHEWENTWVTNPFKDPRWFNKRYWFYFLLSLFVLLFICILYREKSIAYK